MKSPAFAFLSLCSQKPLLASDHPRLGHMDIMKEQKSLDQGVSFLTDDTDNDVFCQNAKKMLLFWCLVFFMLLLKEVFPRRDTHFVLSRACGGSLAPWPKCFLRGSRRPLDYQDHQQ